MRLTINRTGATGEALIGRLYVDGVFECFTLEHLDVCIPAGTYSIEMTYSPAFHRDLPLLDGVPGRSDIRIHPANWPDQLKGCIAVGQSHGDTYLNNPTLALNALLQKMSWPCDVTINDAA